MPSTSSEHMSRVSRCLALVPRLGSRDEGRGKGWSCCRWWPRRRRRWHCRRSGRRAQRGYGAGGSSSGGSSCTARARGVRLGGQRKVVVQVAGEHSMGHGDGDTVQVDGVHRVSSDLPASGGMDHRLGHPGVTRGSRTTPPPRVGCESPEGITSYRAEGSQPSQQAPLHGVHRQRQASAGAFGRWEQQGGSGRGRRRHRVETSHSSGGRAGSSRFVGAR